MTFDKTFKFVTGNIMIAETCKVTSIQNCEMRVWQGFNYLSFYSFNLVYGTVSKLILRYT